MRVPRRFVFSKIEVSSAWFTCGSGVGEKEEGGGMEGGRNGTF